MGRWPVFWKHSHFASHTVSGPQYTWFASTSLCWVATGNYKPPKFLYRLHTKNERERENRACLSESKVQTLLKSFHIARRRPLYLRHLSICCKINKFLSTGAEKNNKTVQHWSMPIGQREGGGSSLVLIGGEELPKEPKALIGRFCLVFCFHMKGPQALGDSLRDVSHTETAGGVF